MNNERVDGFAVLALTFLFFLGFQIFSDRTTTQPAMAMDEVSLGELAATPLQITEFIDYSVVGLPYEDYYLTQGPHGYSYGHNAIDISAGKGSEILSPIHGMVVADFVDELGNPTLILENEIWQVTLMHGEYILSTGEQVSLGQVVGYESNLGYTTDMQGRSCQGRECGYHTHLNIYDKRLSANINPLDVLQP